MLEQFIDIDIHQIRKSHEELNNIKDAIIQEHKRIRRDTKKERLAAAKAQEAERKALEEAERKAREEAERKALEEAERKAREEAERKALEEAERKALEEAERKALEEAERKAREEAARIAKKKAECEAGKINPYCGIQAKYLKYKMKYNILKKQLNI